MFDYLVKARNSRKRGFTIIEMVVVIAIIGILSSILVPNFSGVLSNARTTSEGANIATMNKIAKSALSENDMSMLKGYAAAVQNFGYDNVKATVTGTVYNSSEQQFVKLSKVKDKDGYDLANYYPVAESNGKTALENFKALPFVEMTEYTAKPSGSTLIPKIISKAIVDDFNKYNAAYVVRGSIALYDDLDLGDGVIVFLDGASVELNGKTLGAKAAIFLDTKGGAEAVKFYINGGMLNTLYGFAVTSIKNDSKFWTEDGKLNLAATPADDDFVTDNQIEVYQDAMIESTLGGGYANVAKASYYLYGGIMISGAGTFTLDGNTHFVAKDGAYLLASEISQDSNVERSFSAVKLDMSGDATADVGTGSIVSLTFAENANPNINGTLTSGTNWNSVNPMTYQICANAVQNALVLYAQAGADQASIMAICDKFATSVNTTVATLGAAGIVTGVAADATTFTNINSAMAATVYGAVSSAVNSGAVANVSIGSTAAAGAVVSLAGVQNKAQLAYVASSSVNATNNTSTSSAYDYSFYNESKADGDGGYTTESNGVRVYHIKNALQLYTLSFIVAKGLDDFYGTIVSIDADLDLSGYDPWQPIGNGRYGFRGFMHGNGHSISGMKIDTNSLTTITSLIGQAWSGTSTHAQNEGVNYGIQTGDKYALGFIGVLENGGMLTNLNFVNCRVVFNYNWNCSAGIAVGAVVSTGEDYNYGENAGKYISGSVSGTYNGQSYTFVKYVDGSPTGAVTGYKDTGPKWIYSGNTVTGAQMSNDIKYRAYTAWDTKIASVTTDSQCYVECSGRPGGLIGSCGGRYSKGAPNNDYDTKAPWKTYIGKVSDGQSIFCSFGTLHVSNCTNNATVVQNWQLNGYCDCGGIVAYFVNKGGSDYGWYVTNCTNNGDIYGGICGEIAGDTRPGAHLSGNTGSGHLKYDTGDNNSKWKRWNDAGTSIVAVETRATNIG